MTTAREEEGGATLRWLLGVVRRRKWLILLPMVIVTLVALGLAAREAKEYTSTSQVLLSAQEIVPSVAGTAQTSLSEDAARVVDTQAQLARGEAVAARVLRAAGLHGRTPADFLAQSSVVGQADADILQFAVTDTDPALARRLATLYARQYGNYRNGLAAAGTRTALRQVSAEIQRLATQGQRHSSLYLSLVRKQQQLKTLEALQTSSVYLIKSAANAVQTSPNLKRSLFIGLGIGLVLGLALAFLRELLDTTIRSMDEVSQALGIPLLGRVPQPARSAKGPLVMLDEPWGERAEAYRTLRNNLELVNAERGAKVIAITSPAVGDGKTSTAANLALALAQADQPGRATRRRNASEAGPRTAPGRRVVLVDLDLREPSIAGLFNLSDDGGLTEVVRGELTLSEALIAVPCYGDDLGSAPVSGNRGGRLQVLPTGPRPPNPGEIAAGRTVAKMLADLRKMADFVLIDTPPILEVGDAIALSAEVDALLVVVREGALRRPALAELQRVLSTSPAERLGIVVSGVESAKLRYGSGAHAVEPRRARGPNAFRARKPRPFLRPFYRVGRHRAPHPALEDGPRIRLASFEPSGGAEGDGKSTEGWGVEDRPGTTP